MAMPTWDVNLKTSAPEVNGSSASVPLTHIAVCMVLVDGPATVGSGSMAILRKILESKYVARLPGHD